jgi:predicted alpha/beta-hydrolase family hydrolase
VEEVSTPYGPARYVLDVPAGPPACIIVLGHGAGGGVDAVDLLAVRDSALAAGVAVARVTQPYRVAGRRAPAPVGQLDAAWLAVIETIRRPEARLIAAPLAAAPLAAAPLAAAPPVEVPLIVGGRSSGARVACRTARSAGAVGVIALAFPLHPPGRPERSRASELPVDLPVLVVNGAADPFGIPDPTATVKVVVRPGERHDLRRDPMGVGDVVLDWLRHHGWARQ